MYPKSIATYIIVFFLSIHAMFAQNKTSTIEADIHSYSLYENGKWKELLYYSTDYLKNGGEDFLYLRLRMGYAAFMLNNFSEAIKHYNAVLKKDHQNGIAHYYIKQCRIFLKQDEMADFENIYLSEKIKPYNITGISTEGSFKSTNTASRENAYYQDILLSTRLHRKLHMQHGLNYYSQAISETDLTGVTKNNQIQINQPGYYNRTSFNINNRWQIIGAYHYTYTPFNNFTYNNHIGMLGVKYFSNYWSLQADAILGNMIDTSLQQYDLQLALYPLGNMNLYFFTTGTMRSRKGENNFNLHEVAGMKLCNKLWIQGNITIGSFNNYFENDAFYVYNSIDKDIIKTGGTIFYTIKSKLSIHLGYTFEQKQLYNKEFYYYQHSITGGLSCKF